MEVCPECLSASLRDSVRRATGRRLVTGTAATRLLSCAKAKSKPFLDMSMLSLLMCIQ